MMQGGRPPRESGKSVNPISRGNNNNLANGFDDPSPYQAELGAFNQLNN